MSWLRLFSSHLITEHDVEPPDEDLGVFVYRFELSLMFSRIRVTRRMTSRMIIRRDRGNG